MEAGRKLQKSYFDVLGLCCPSEVPLIEGVLRQLDGINDYSVLVPTKTVIVLHDSIVISQNEIVKALNRARLEANVQLHGQPNYKNKWPSPYSIASGALLLLSFLKYFYGPLRWLAVGAVAVGIPPIALKAVAALRRPTLDVNILVLITVGGSIALRDYWEAGTIVFLFTIADWLEARASHKATAVMSSLVNVVPQRAVLADTGEEIDVDEVKLNTILAVKAGEVIPIDGVVVEGSCEVDEKVLTGESFPVPKQNDSIVWASTINLNGYISVRTTAVAEDCVVARMAKIVEEAQSNKSQTQRFMDKCAKYYTPAIVVISGLVAIVPLAFHLKDKRKWFHLALVVLVSGCPCALLLSTPVAIFCALSKAATLGVLFKGAEHLENLSKIKIMAFDKTGTVTRGEFQVVDFKSRDDDVSVDQLLYWVSSIECKSSHPMAEALVDYARQHSIEPRPENVDRFENFPGEGIYGKIEDNEIYIGSKKIASKAGCTEVSFVEGHDMEGKSTGYIFKGSSLVGLFALSDMCRTGAKEAIKDLKSMGVKTVMLTGDCLGAADRAQQQLDGSLDLVRAELLPEGKARAIEELQRDGPTAMIGDGLNDAPALAVADLGISMGVSGSALATETGHIILMSNDLQRIPRAYNLSKKARRKIYENVVLSISTKAGILGLAIAGHPLVWAAVLVDVGTCLLVIFNSMLLLRGARSVRGKETCRRSKRSSRGSCSSPHEHEHSHCHGGHGRAKAHGHCHEKGHVGHAEEACTNLSAAEHEHSHCHGGHGQAKAHGHCHEKGHMGHAEEVCTNMSSAEHEHSHCHGEHGQAKAHGHCHEKGHVGHAEEVCTNISTAEHEHSHCHGGHDQAKAHGHCHENEHVGHAEEVCSNMSAAKHEHSHCHGGHGQAKAHGHCHENGRHVGHAEEACANMSTHNHAEQHEHSHCHGGHDRAKPYGHVGHAGEVVITPRIQDSKCCGNKRPEDAKSSKECDSLEVRAGPSSDHDNLDLQGTDERCCNGHSCEGDKDGGLEQEEHGSGHCKSKLQPPCGGGAGSGVAAHKKCCGESFRRECCRRDGDSLARLCEIVIE